MISSQPQH